MNTELTSAEQQPKCTIFMFINIKLLWNDLYIVKALRK